MYTSALEASAASSPARPASSVLFRTNLPGANPPRPVGLDLVGDAGAFFDAFAF